MTSPDRGTTTYQYDPAGNRISKTDARGVTVNYAYDALNRLSSVAFPTDTDVTYTYDGCTNGKGRLCQVQDQTGTASFTYNVIGGSCKKIDSFLVSITRRATTTMRMEISYQ